MSEEVPFWFSLCRHSKQAGDESHLPKDISFVHSLHLSFPDHVHDLIALQGSPRRLEGKEAHPWLDQPFDKTMVLLDQVVEVFDQDVSSTLSASIPAAFRHAMKRRGTLCRALHVRGSWGESISSPHPTETVGTYETA
jgi:hypothetical protein